MNTNSNYQHNQQILQNIENLLQHALAKHNKVFFVRFDVSFPEHETYLNPSPLISNFNESLIRYFKRKKLDPYYLWVREQKTSLNPHYHFIMLLDGNKIQHSYSVHIKAEQLWNKQLKLPENNKGLIDYCNKYSNGVMIYRNDSDSYEDAANWASYLSKIDDKNINAEFRSQGMSNLK